VVVIEILLAIFEEQGSSSSSDTGAGGIELCQSEWSEEEMPVVRDDSRSLRHSNDWGGD
jgi:hypothetical protein